jgi:hypothetical protein
VPAQNSRTHVNKLRDKQEEPKAEPEKASKADTVRMPGSFISVLNGSFLTKDNVLGNMPFILFCAGMMIVYIAYGYHTERIVRDLDRTGTELKELRSEYITVRATVGEAGTAEPGGRRDRCAGIEAKAASRP